jgi:hypothetical protein
MQAMWGSDNDNASDNSSNNNNSSNSSNFMKFTSDPILNTSIPKSSISSNITLPDLSDVDMSAMPMIGEHKPKQTFAGELSNRCGISYFSGLIASGFYGAFQGWRLSHKGMPIRLRFNSLLNHAMKLGAHNGNMFAILSMYFVSSKRLIPKLSPIDVHPELNLILAGGSAGAIYKSFHGPKVILRWSLCGACIPATYVLLTFMRDQ